MACGRARRLHTISRAKTLPNTCPLVERSMNTEWGALSSLGGAGDQTWDSEAMRLEQRSSPSHRGPAGFQQLLTRETSTSAYWAANKAIEGKLPSVLLQIVAKRRQTARLLGRDGRMVDGRMVRRRSVPGLVLAGSVHKCNRRSRNPARPRRSLVAATPS